jgi:hypothetical protein
VPRARNIVAAWHEPFGLCREARPIARRTKTIPRFFDEKSCLKSVFAALIRASQRWRGVRMSDKDLQTIDRLSLRLGISKLLQVALESNPMRLLHLSEKS